MPTMPVKGSEKMSRRRRYYSSTTRLTTDFIMLVFNCGLAAISALLLLVKELASAIVTLIKSNKKSNSSKAKKSNAYRDTSKENINVTLNENINVVVNQSVNFNINSTTNEGSHTPDIIMDDNQYTSLDTLPNLEGLKEKEPMLPDAVKAVVEAGAASTSIVQRKLNIGYAHAARLVDIMEQQGIVGPYRGSKPRKVLISAKSLEA